MTRFTKLVITSLHRIHLGSSLTWSSQWDRIRLHTQEARDAQTTSWPWASHFRLWFGNFQMKAPWRRGWRFVGGRRRISAFQYLPCFQGDSWQSQVHWAASQKKLCLMFLGCSYSNRAMPECWGLCYFY